MSVPVVWWGVRKMVRPLRPGLTASCCPEPGTVDGSAASQASKRPLANTVDSGRPGGAAFLQHDLYTASDLAVIVPPAALAARSGSRGSLCMGTPTSPYAALHRLPTGSVPDTVATSGVMCTPQPRHSWGQLQKKSRCGGAQRLFRPFAYSTGTAIPERTIFAASTT